MAAERNKRKTERYEQDTVQYTVQAKAVWLRKCCLIHNGSM